LLSQIKQKNSFFRSVLTLTSGTVVAQLITILASPVITRLFSPADMGTLASFLAITAIFGIIATGNYEAAIVLPENDSDANSLVYLAGIIAIVFGIVITILFIFFNKQLADILKMQNIPNFWLYGIGLFVILISFETILNRLLIRRKHFKISATTSVTQQISTNGIKISTGFFHLGTNGLLLGTVFGHLIRAIRLMIAERDFIFDKEKMPNISIIKNIALRYKKFPLISVWSSLLNVASIQVPVILFANLFSAEVVGYYSLGHRILSLPMVFIGHSVANVFMERAARLRGNEEELKRITLGIYKKLLFIGTITMSFVTFYGKWIFPFVFGKEWVEAGVYAQWISIWIIFQLSVSPISSIFYVLEKQGESFLWNIFLFISRISVIFFSLYLKSDIIIVIILYSLTSAIVYFIYSLRILLLVKNKIFSILQCILKYFLSVYGIQLGIYHLLRYFVPGFK
jgi:O-antigen/teichoic acid export membrane protein